MTRQKLNYLVALVDVHRRQQNRRINDCRLVYERRLFQPTHYSRCIISQKVKLKSLWTNMFQDRKKMENMLHIFRFVIGRLLQKICPYQISRNNPLTKWLFSIPLTNFRFDQRSGNCNLVSKFQICKVNTSSKLFNTVVILKGNSIPRVCAVKKLINIPSSPQLI